MSKSLELSDATYDAIAARAAKAGLTPEKLLEMQFRSVSHVPPKPGETMYDQLKDFIGCVEGKGEDLAVKHSDIFGDELQRGNRTGEQ